jgi:hypothetical protein
VVVFGQEMAQALEREERHRATTGAVASPLAGIAYDPRSGELDLHRFVESPVDTAVSEFAASYEKLGSEEAGDVRGASSMDDYTLLAFVRRSVLASLRSRSNPSLHHGLVGVADEGDPAECVDDTCGDGRTVPVAYRRPQRSYAARSGHGAEGDRTPDLPDAIRTLSQLSYGPGKVES